jgi:D-tyrosyl-tRNA(Tyr) deacylase
VRFVIQRVTEASVVSDGILTGQIGHGFMVLIGVGADDDEAIADKMVTKMLGLRIFMDGDGKTNLSISDVGGSLLLVSQFTLLADCRKGNRPSFIKAGPPEHAEAVYDYIVRLCRESGIETACGVFGANMKVSLTNEGPFTIVLDSDEMLKPRRS